MMPALITRPSRIQVTIPRLLSRPLRLSIRTSAFRTRFAFGVTRSTTCRCRPGCLTSRRSSSPSCTPLRFPSLVFSEIGRPDLLPGYATLHTSECTATGAHSVGCIRCCRLIGASWPFTHQPTSLVCSAPAQLRGCRAIKGNRFENLQYSRLAGLRYPARCTSSRRPVTVVAVACGCDRNVARCQS